jgi:hypothetical protein
MTKLCLTAAAIMLAAITTSKAEPSSEKWEFDGRQCHVRKSLGSLEQGWGDAVALHLDDVLELQKHIRDLKACDAFWQCTADRDAGKVKHCYQNDRRWRHLFQ